MNRRKIIPIYLAMLMVHLAHVFEEACGEFRAMRIVGGLGPFLTVNWVLIGLVVLLLHFVILQRKWAYRLSLVYAGVMTLNGIGHGIGVAATGEYFGGFAGCFTGIALMILGPVMAIHLLREMPAE
jgi:hypothetical protein